MRLSIYKEMKLEGKPVIYETDTANIYDEHGNYLCVGFLDGKVLKRAVIIGELTGKAVVIKKPKKKED